MIRKLVCLSLVSIVLSATLILVPACASTPFPETDLPAAAYTTPVNLTSQSPGKTEFARMLGYVPYSFLNDHDAWFGDPAEALAIYGIQGINSLDDLKELPEEQRNSISLALSGIAAPIWKSQQLAPIAGFDYWMTDRDIFVDTPPPWAFSVSTGSFDRQLINDKLISLGYQKADYDSYPYYTLNQDFSPGNLSNPISQAVLAAMNRIAVMDDNTVITAPATDIMNGILDTMTGESTSIADSPAGQSLATSLGDVLSAVIMNPERTLNMNAPQAVQPFKFNVLADWGTLHEYAMTGIGFKNDGQNRYLVFSLYYTDAAAAREDAGTLVNRMKGYILNTRIDQGPGQGFEQVPFTDKFDVGEPEVQQYQIGATLTIACRFKPGTPSSYWIIPMATFRDFLFLAPDPSAYVAK